MVNKVICQLTFSQRQEAVRQLNVLRHDHGDSQSTEWHAGVDACIIALNYGAYQNRQYNTVTQNIEIVDVNDKYAHPSQAPVMSNDERFAIGNHDPEVFVSLRSK